MIRCLLVQILRNSKGQAVRKEQLLLGESIQIGRAAECKVLLPSRGVNLYHALIRHGEDGRLYVQAQEGGELFVNDALVKQAECVPGTQIWIGAFRLEVEPSSATEYDLTLAVEAVEEGETPGVEWLPRTLSQTGLSKRRLAFWFALPVVVLFLLLPLLQSLPFTRSAKLPAAFQEIWNLGQMSSGHRALSGQCNACHELPFTAVADKACKTCHSRTETHLANHALQQSAFQNMRCADCHPDHRGDAKIHAAQQCVSCHGNIKAKKADSRHPDIHDFSRDHPSFKLTLKTGHEAHEFRQISQAYHTQIKEKSGLKFSHQVHLSKKGISTPDGDTVMACQDCHQLDESGARFNPISMAKSCQQSGCHALDFEPPVMDRPLPHGSEARLMSTLREYYAKFAIEQMQTEGTRQCGGEPTTGANLLARAQSCAQNRVNTNLEKLFQTDNEGCVVCHEVSQDEEDAELPWKIHAVNLTRHWLRQAKFNHSRHETVKCTNCHDKENSKKSEDVSIPDIKKCRECHVGTQVVKGKVSMSCEACHVFHRHEGAASKQSGSVN